MAEVFGIFETMTTFVVISSALPAWGNAIGDYNCARVRGSRMVEGVVNFIQSYRYCLRPMKRMSWAYRFLSGHTCRWGFNIIGGRTLRYTSKSFVGEELGQAPELRKHGRG